VLLPVNTTATWLNATYAATRADVAAGIWILKMSVLALAATGLLLRRWRLPVADHLAWQEAPRSDARLLLLLSAVLLIGLALRLYRIDAELWLDEILWYALCAARIPAADQHIRQPESSATVFDSGPSVVSGRWWHGLVAAHSGSSLRRRKPCRRLVVRQAGDFEHRSDAGRVAARCLVSPRVVLAEREGYTLMLFLALLGTGVFLRMLEGGGPQPRLAWGYALAMSLATYTHLTAALIAVGHAFALLLTTRWNSPDARRRASWPAIALALSALLTVCFYAPMLPQVWRLVTTPTMEDMEVEWTGAGWMLSEGARVLAQGVPGGLVTVFGALAVLGVGVASYWRQSRAVTLLMYLPIGVTFVAIVAATQPLAAVLLLRGRVPGPGRAARRVRADEMADSLASGTHWRDGCRGDVRPQLDDGASSMAAEAAIPDRLRLR
jgi:hypothetical protein